MDATPVLFFLVIIVTAQALSSSQGKKTITATGTVGAYSYVIFKDGNYTVLQDVKTGTEMARSTDAVYVINTALNEAASKGGGSILLKYANYSLSSNVIMKSNTALILEAGVTIEATYTAQSPYWFGKAIIQFNNNYPSQISVITNAHIICQNGQATIKGKGDSGQENGILFMYASECSVKNIEVTNTGNMGVYMWTATNNVLENVYVHGYGKYPVAQGVQQIGILLHIGSNYNKLNNVHVDGENGQYAGGCLMFNGGVKHNEIHGGIYERSGWTHAIYWCSDAGDTVDGNIAIGGLSRGCRGSSYSCGFKLNPAINSYIDWTVENCTHGVDIGDGGPEGNHGNVVYATITNTVIGSDLFVQNSANANVANNEIHLDIDGATYAAIGFIGFSHANDSYVMNNTIYCKARNLTTDGIRFGDYGDMSAIRESKYNTFYLDIQTTRYGIHWDTSGFGRWNTFYGTWHGNTADLYSESGQAVIDMNTFNPGPFPLTGVRISPAITPTTLLQTGTLQFTATPTGGTPATLVYTWYINNVSAGTEATFTLVGSEFGVGDSTTVHCTCSDGTNSYTSNSVIVAVT